MPINEKRAIFLSGLKIDLCVLDVEKDIDLYRAWVNDQSTTRYMGIGNYPVTDRELEAYIRKYNASKDFLLGIFLKDGSHIGNVTLHQIDMQNRNAEIGILIGALKARGQGYGTEAVSLLVEHAFNRLNLHKITTGMIDGNTASQKMFERLGFQKEGRLREQFYLDGEYHDCFRYGLIQKERKG